MSVVRNDSSPVGNFSSGEEEKEKEEDIQLQKEDFRLNFEQVFMGGRPSSETVIRILCIDGGGLRGIVPSVVLARLEKELQVLKDENARLADYFDVIVGTSTGGLITALLTFPNEDGRPRYTAAEVKQFYLDHGGRIFPPSRNFPLYRLLKVISNFWRSRYDGEYLRSIIGDTLQQTRLIDTVTNVVITAYDMITMKPVIFSSNDHEDNSMPYLKLSDVCLGSAAAPTIFPSHHFSTYDDEGSLIRDYNLVDGGLVANNPALLAIFEALKQRQGIPCKFLVLSLGTGCEDYEGRYTATKPYRWGIIRWVSRFLDVYSSSSSYMAEYHVDLLMKALRSDEGSYLRIQDNTLSGDTASMDLATDENMRNLEEVGNRLVREHEPGIKRFAKLLHEEQEFRMDRQRESCAIM